MIKLLNQDFIGIGSQGISFKQSSGDGPLTVVLTSLGIVDGLPHVSVVFSRAVTGLVLGDFTVVNGTADYLTSSDNITFTVYILPDTLGDVQVSLAQGVCSASDGTLNTASNTVTVNLVNPVDLGFDFYADMLTAGSFIYSSGAIVEQVINKDSVGTTFPELVTNGTFASNVTGWTGSIATVAWDSSNGGCMKVTNTTAGFGYGVQTISTVTGTQYRVRASAIQGTATSYKLQVRNTSDSASIINDTQTAATYNYDLAFTALGTTTDIRLVNDNVNGSTMFWDNVMLVEMDAEFQPDTTRQPTLVQDAVNGHPALLFDGSADFLQSKQKYVGATFTKFATIVFDSSTTNTAYIIGCATNASHSLHIIKSGTTAIINGSSGEGITYTVTLLDVVNALTIVECVDTSGDKELYINGVLVDTSSTVDTHSDFTWMLGSHTTAGSTVCYKGYIADHGIKTAKLSSDDVALLDNHQRLRYRLPVDKNDYVTVAGAGQSNVVGYATAQSDPITAGRGFNFIPSIRHFREPNDRFGEDYFRATNGSHWPVFINKLFTLSGKKSVVMGCGKTATSISTVSSSDGADRTLDWGSGSTLRSNFVDHVDGMLTYFNRTNLDWCIIGQGERDVTYMAANPSWTKALYKAAFLDLINFIKTEYPGVKILVVQTIQERNTGTDAALNTTEWTAIIEAQQELAASESNVFIIQDTTTFTITNGRINATDGIHYSKAGNVIIGESEATKINQNL